MATPCGFNGECLQIATAVAHPYDSSPLFPWCVRVKAPAPRALVRCGCPVCSIAGALRPYRQWRRACVYRSVLGCVHVTHVGGGDTEPAGDPAYAISERALPCRLPGRPAGLRGSHPLQQTTECPTQRWGTRPYLRPAGRRHCGEQSCGSRDPVGAHPGARRHEHGDHDLVPLMCAVCGPAEMLAAGTGLTAGSRSHSSRASKADRRADRGSAVGSGRRRRCGGYRVASG